jgi:hypothetical protein
MASASAQLILIDNDFESLTAGDTVNSGDPYGGTGSDADLGNAALHQDSDVTASAGVGGSQAITFSNGGISSRNTFDVTQETTFDFYFKYSTDTRNDSFLYVGWGDPPTISAFSGGQADKDDVVSFGLVRTNGANEVGYSGATGGGAISNMSKLTDSPSFTLTDGNFYRFTGSTSLELNEAGADEFWEVTLSDFQLRDYGANGDTAGSILGQWAGTTFDANDDYGRDFMADSQAQFFMGANSPRGANNFDNVSVTGIPEPRAGLLLALGLLALAFKRRRA